jgi:hypothetical protein
MTAEHLRLALSTPSNSHSMVIARLDRAIQ